MTPRRQLAIGLPNLPEEFRAEDFARRHRNAFEHALHEVGVRRFGSPAEIQALEQV